eukprot:1151627-Pelagomonas_calceolata.AAC.3
MKVNTWHVKGLYMVSRRQDRTDKGKTTKSRKAVCITGSLTSKLKGSHHKAFKPKLGITGLGEIQKLNSWGSGGLLAMLLDAQTLFLPFSTQWQSADRPASPLPDAPPPLRL